MDPFKTQYYDGFAPEDDSDVDLNELDSSDEEKLDSSLNKYLSKVQAAAASAAAQSTSEGQKSCKKRKSASSFEAQMDDELEEAMAEQSGSTTTAASGQEPKSLKKVKFNDQVTTIERSELAEAAESAVNEDVDSSKPAASAVTYEAEEDTDSEQELETGQRCTKKRVHYTNDDLFYDPDRDEKDQDWINARRKTCVAKKSSPSPLSKPAQTATTSAAAGAATSSASAEEPAYETKYKEAQTDAILNCPCCMSLLCMDCQRHEKYQTQFRAMFVFNCKVVRDEVLKYPRDDKQQRRGAAAKKNLSNLTTNFKQIDFEEKEFDEYKPVKCTKCDTEVGVYEEKDELYHFFNVLTGH